MQISASSHLCAVVDSANASGLKASPRMWSCVFLAVTVSVVGESDARSSLSLGAGNHSNKGNKVMNLASRSLQEMYDADLGEVAFPKTHSQIARAARASRRIAGDDSDGIEEEDNEEDEKAKDEDLSVSALSGLANGFLPNEIAASIVALLIALKSLHENLQQSFSSMPALSCIGFCMLLSVFASTVCWTYLDSVMGILLLKILGDWVVLSSMLATLTLLTTPLLLFVPDQKRAKVAGIAVYGRDVASVASRSFNTLNAWALRVFLVLMVLQVCSVVPVFLLASLVTSREDQPGASSWSLAGPWTISLLYLLLAWCNISVVYERLIGGCFAADFPGKVFSTVFGFDLPVSSFKLPSVKPPSGSPGTGISQVDGVAEEISAIHQAMAGMCDSFLKQSQSILDAVNSLLQGLHPVLFRVHWLCYQLYAMSLLALVALIVEKSVHALDQRPAIYVFVPLCTVLSAFVIAFTFWATMGMLHILQKSSTKTSVDSERRRLSVGGAHGNSDAENEGQILDEDRSLIANLQQQDVIEMMKDNHGGRKFSIGSAKDDSRTSGPPSIGLHMTGDLSGSNMSGLGYTCRKGLQPECPNQDSCLALRVDQSFSIYGVFDGHGKKGHDVSNFVKDNLPKLIIKDRRFMTAEMNQMLFDVFRKMQSLVGTADRMKKLSAQMSGTTCSVAIHDHTQDTLTIAHVADSAVVMGSYVDEQRSQLVAAQLTRNHKPALEAEKSRIEEAGGRVVFDGHASHRVYAKNGRYPGLSMSRSIGDLLGHQDAGLSVEPEVTTIKLKPLDHVLLLCSNGVWEFITPEEAVNMVSDFSAETAMQATEKLVQEAWDRGIRDGAVVDDLTVILVFLQSPMISSAEIEI